RLRREEVKWLRRRMFFCQTAFDFRELPANCAAEVHARHTSLPSLLGGEGVSLRETVEGDGLLQAPGRPACLRPPPHSSGSAAHLLPRGEKEGDWPLQAHWQARHSS